MTSTLSVPTLGRTGTGRNVNRRRHTRSPRLEPLEERTLLSTVDPELDKMFNGGYVTRDVSPPSMTENSEALAVQTVAVTVGGKPSLQERILWGGTSWVAGKFSYVGNFAVFRQTTTGAIDAAFGKDGVATVDFGGANDSLEKIVVLNPADPNSKILLVGISETNLNSVSTTQSVALARLNANGTLDTTFGTAGKAVFGPSPQKNSFGSYIGDVAIDGAGNIVVVGAGKLPSSRWGVSLYNWIIRCRPGGALDTTFATGGMLIGTPSSADAGYPPDHDRWTDARIAPDGTIDVVGARNRTPTIGHIAPSGKLTDPATTFVTQACPAGPADENMYPGGGGVFQSDGKVVIVDNDRGPTGHSLMVVRNLPDGTIDPSFGTDHRPSDAPPDSLLPGSTTVDFSEYFNAHTNPMPDGSVPYPDLFPGHIYAARTDFSWVMSGGTFDPHGNLIAFGEVSHCDTSSATPDATVVRYNVMLRFLGEASPDGTRAGALDRSFGVDGVSATTFPGFTTGSPGFSDVLARPDGTILAVGGLKRDHLLVRFLSPSTAVAVTGSMGTGAPNANYDHLLARFVLPSSVRAAAAPAADGVGAAVASSATSPPTSPTWPKPAAGSSLSPSRGLASIRAWTSPPRGSRSHPPAAPWGRNAGGPFALYARRR